MSQPVWSQHPIPELSSAVLTRLAWEISSRGDISSSRRQLRSALTSRSPSAQAELDGDDLLLAFEELVSNGLRHGHRPVRVAVTMTERGWLLDVSDGAPDRAPVPALDRDPADGGLGLNLVARLAARHGWFRDRERKHVWACLPRAVTV